MEWKSEIGYISDTIQLVNEMYKYLLKLAKTELSAYYEKY